MTERSQILAGWKQIAHYLNCGVRTVQRWEEIGCPIHRPHNKKRSAVIALSGEIDEWIRSTASENDQAEGRTRSLKARIAELERENEFLKTALERAPRGEGSLPPERLNAPAGGRRNGLPSSAVDS